jgi:hypothetical protein
MRRLGSAAILCVGLLFPTFSNAAVRRPAPMCRPRHPVLAATSRAEVYRVQDRFDSEGKYVGCVYGHRVVYLDFANSGGSSSPGVGFLDFTISGNLVAYVDTEGPSLVSFNATESHGVIVRDLRTGHLVHRVPSGRYPCVTDPKALEFTGEGPVMALVLAPGGAVAWISEVRENPICGVPIGEEHVHLLDTTGEDVLASGTGITGLALAGHVLYWSQDGQAHSAPVT